MKQVMKKMLVTMLCVTMAMQLTGCMFFGFSGKDAQTYVKGYMDAKYLESYDAYAKACNVSVDEARDGMQQVVKEEVQLVINELPGMSQEQMDRITDIMTGLYKTAKYEVLEGTKSDNGFDVLIKVQPSDFFELYAKNQEEELMKKLDEGADLSQDGIVYDIVLDVMESSLSGSSAQAETEITVTVFQEESGLWSLSQEDITLIEDTLFPQNTQG